MMETKAEKLKRYTLLLEEGKLDRDEYESLVKGLKDLDDL
jgi:hypothetical protein